MTSSIFECNSSGKFLQCSFAEIFSDQSGADHTSALATAAARRDIAFVSVDKVLQEKWYVAPLEIAATRSSYATSADTSCDHFSAVLKLTLLTGFLCDHRAGQRSPFPDRWPRHRLPDKRGLCDRSRPPQDKRSGRRPSPRLTVSSPFWAYAVLHKRTEPGLKLTCLD